MLTDEQLYITPEIQEQIEDDFETYIFNLETPSDETPYYDFPFYELENYPNLKRALITQGKKQEFIVNSGYYLLNQIKFYLSHNITFSSSIEMSFNDLRDIYKNYNFSLISQKTII